MLSVMFILAYSFLLALTATALLTACVYCMNLIRLKFFLSKYLFFDLEFP